MTEAHTTSIRTRLYLYLVLIDLLVMLLAIVARMLLDWPPLTAFHVFFYGAQVGLALAVVGLLQAAYGLVRKIHSHRLYGALTLCLALLPLLISLAVVGVAGFRAPMIHDISTDMEDPPQFSIISSLRTAEENSLEYAGEPIASQQRAAFPDIAPLYSDLTPHEASLRVLQVVDQLGWVLVVNDQSTGSIEAYDESRIFGFIDDVVVRISAAADGSRIDVRSVSRVGLGDLGANARRIRHFFRALQKTEGMASERSI